eukprot:CAMPEP_0170138920 /NCGR_PEP_ID=MMETSP0033_2-20121228/5288_1 /TAXON_ID=195969 /ORGANISM="Dolichomastix tenuilepis, Strain CCMP3274" /LENGTH=899 /DNA_ID=CAMNT_0010374987 /DNA_START=95 /DNA_END=2794 /DNA_ORIENTATION=-
MGCGASAEAAAPESAPAPAAAAPAPAAGAAKAPSARDANRLSQLPPGLTETELRTRKASIAKRLKKKRIAVAAEELVSTEQLVPVEKSDDVKAVLMAAVVENALFGGLDEAARAAVVGVMYREDVSAGVDVTTQGDTQAEKFYVMQTGSADVWVRNEGEPESMVQQLGAGDAFGDLALLYNTPRAATVKATSDLVLWVMERKAWQSIKRAANEKVERMKTQLLNDVPLFKHFSSDLKLSLAEAMEPVEFHKYETIFKKGDIGDKFYLIQEGEVRVMDGDKELTTLSAGGFFGERALISDDTRAATIEVKSETVSCMFINREVFVSLLGPLEDVWRAEAMRGVSLLSHLSDDQLASLSKLMIKQEVKEGEFVFRKGDSGDLFYVVDSGMLCAEDESGAELARLDKGSGFGELALLQSDTRKASVKALADSNILALSRTDLERTLGSLQALQLAWTADALRRVPILAQLTPEQRSRLASTLTSKSYPAGTRLCTMGEVEQTFYILERGQCVITDNSGTEHAQLSLGAYFGELSLLRHEPRAANVIAKTEVIVLECQKEVFDSQLGPLQQILDTQARAYDAIGSSKIKCELGDLDRKAVLGVGAFGKVFLVKYNTKMYALKTLCKAQLVKVGLSAAVLRERNILMECECPFIVNLVATFKDVDHLYLMLETVMGGELFSFLQMHDVTEEHSQFFSACVVVAFDYLASLKVAYRDLKPENLLINGDGYLKVVDFGFAKKIDSGKTYTMCGTPDYLAPELVSQEGHNRAVDWWAVGVLIFEITAGYPPFEAPDPMKQMRAIKACKYSFPKFFSAACKDIVKKFLVVNPTKRLGMLKAGALDVKKHPWYKDLDWAALENRTLTPPYIPKLKANDDTSHFDYFDIEEPQPGSEFTARVDDSIFADF